MNSKPRLFHVATCVAVLLSAAVASRANTVTGTAYCNQSNTTAAPVGTPCATFTTTDLNFNDQDTNPADYNLGTFFASGTGVGPVTYAPGYSAATSLGGSAPGEGTLFEFTGTTSLVTGTTYYLTHDDGVIVYINGGLYLSEPNPTEQTTDTYLATFDGDISFDILYTESDNAPAVLQSNLTDVPEPSTIMMLGTGLLGLGGVVRRRMGV